jgi:hypothetical protein
MSGYSKNESALIGFSATQPPNKDAGTLFYPEIFI